MERFTRGKSGTVSEFGTAKSKYLNQNYFFHQVSFMYFRGMEKCMFPRAAELLLLRYTVFKHSFLPFCREIKQNDFWRGFPLEKKKVTNRCKAWKY